MAEGQKKGGGAGSSNVMSIICPASVEVGLGGGGTHGTPGFAINPTYYPPRTSPTRRIFGPPYFIAVYPRLYLFEISNTVSDEARLIEKL